MMTALRAISSILRSLACFMLVDRLQEICNEIQTQLACLRLILYESRIAGSYPETQIALAGKLSLSSNQPVAGSRPFFPLFRFCDFPFRYHWVPGESLRSRLFEISLLNGNERRSSNTPDEQG